MGALIMLVIILAINLLVYILSTILVLADTTIEVCLKLSASGIFKRLSVSGGMVIINMLALIPLLIIWAIVRIISFVPIVHYIVAPVGTIILLPYILLSGSISSADLGTASQILFQRVLFLAIYLVPAVAVLLLCKWLFALSWVTAIYIGVYGPAILIMGIMFLCCG